MKDAAITGCILGTAVGDALGLPYEGMSPRRARKIFKDLNQHHFFFGRGMVSDDTEHTCFTAQALSRSRGNPDVFEKYLARSLRWWLLGLPAGVGFATLRSIIKLWLGFSPGKSGVFSAGNGPAMRSALPGVCYGDRIELLKDIVRRSTRITHSDPKAYFGSLAVSVAAYQASTAKQTSPQDYIKLLARYLKAEPAGEFIRLMDQAASSALRREPVAVFAESIGCVKGISGYIYHTVPCVIQTWLRSQKDFESGLAEIFGAGGDTDTTGAILGAIIGAGVGKEGIPSEWVNKIIDWPRSVNWMETLSHQLAESLQEGQKHEPVKLSVPGLLARNLFFMLLVLIHGLRRLLPPY